MRAATPAAMVAGKQISRSLSSSFFSKGSQQLRAAAPVSQAMWQKITVRAMTQVGPKSSLRSCFFTCNWFLWMCVSDWSKFSQYVMTEHAVFKIRFCEMFLTQYGRHRR